MAGKGRWSLFCKLQQADKIMRDLPVGSRLGSTKQYRISVTCSKTATFYLSTTLCQRQPDIWKYRILAQNKHEPSCLARMNAYVCVCGGVAPTVREGLRHGREKEKQCENQGRDSCRLEPVNHQGRTRSCLCEHCQPNPTGLCCCQHWLSGDCRCFTVSYNAFQECAEQHT